MKSLILKDANVVSFDGILENKNIYIKDGIIDEVSLRAPKGEFIDIRGMYVLPGFIDLHFHGIEGFCADNERDVAQIMKLLPKYGVTSALPAIQPKEKKEDEISYLNALSKNKYKGANLLGFFLEGQFLSLSGSIKRAIRDEDKKQLICDYKEAAYPYETVFGVSPEYENALELIPLMIKNKYNACFITHTFATGKETINAIKKGAKHATHFYNVFPYGEDKEPGVRRCGAVEAIYSRKDVTVDFILDGEHVEPLALKMAITCKGVENVSLITDSNVVAGLRPGSYIGTGGRFYKKTYDGGPARVEMDSGNKGILAGSGLTMDLAFKNALKMLGVSIEDAAKMVSYSPAKVLNINNKKGKIDKGFDADLVVLDHEYNVIMTVVSGEIVYSKIEKTKL